MSKHTSNAFWNTPRKILSRPLLNGFREETSGLGSKRNKEDEKSDKKDKRWHNRSYNTTFTSTRCIVTLSKENHSAWDCGAFMALSVTDRNELITKIKRCYRCLAAGHQKNKCPNVRWCRINGCESNQHSRYLHELNQHNPKQRYNNTNGITPEQSAKTNEMSGQG